MEFHARDSFDTAAAPRLTIVTVVKDDLPGLVATLASTGGLRGYSFEHWVIDGSRSAAVRDYLSGRGDVSWISEPDGGIFDAMNKGLERARGDYALFLNAGDILSESLEVAALFERLGAETRVLIGHTIEAYGELRWLRPGVNRAADVFNSPAHQATFYPRRFYAGNRYVVQLRISSDGAYTYHAIMHCGAAYLPLIVCEFKLGGVSSNYDSARVLKQRLREAETARQRVLLLLKFVLWRILPRRMFYSLLGAFKYTRLSGRDVPRLKPAEISRPPGGE